MSDIHVVKTMNEHNMPFIYSIVVNKPLEPGLYKLTLEETTDVAGESFIIEEYKVEFEQEAERDY